MTAQLLTAFPRLRMVATDYDAAMVARAQHLLTPFGDRASADRADAADLPFDSGRFGFVLSAASIAGACPRADTVPVWAPAWHVTVARRGRPARCRQPTRGGGRKPGRRADAPGVIEAILTATRRTPGVDLRTEPRRGRSRATPRRRRAVRRAPPQMASTTGKGQWPGNSARRCSR